VTQNITDKFDKKNKPYRAFRMLFRFVSVKLPGTKGVLPYQILVAIFIFLGALQEVDIVWMLADTFNALMVIPNLFGLFFLSNQVKAVLEDYDRCKLEGRIFYDYDVK
ncbi:alanine:cation symporter family protein, partial [Trichococcus flocculiformis]